MTGVFYDKARERYVARPTVSGKRVYLGRFETEAEAELAVGLYKGQVESAKEDETPTVRGVYVTNAMRAEETRPEKPNVFTRIKGRLRKYKVLS